MTQILLILVLIAVWFLHKNSKELKQINKALDEYLANNLSYRTIIPGKSQTSRIAEKLNALIEKNQQEQEREEQQKKAYQELLTNISHDLRTPLTSIAGYTDALKRYKENSQRYLDIISLKTEEVIQLTDDLFYLTRLSSGDLILEQEQLDLNELLKQTILTFQNQLEDISVHIELPENPYYLRADIRSLRRILVNIIANSIKHGKGKENFGITLKNNTLTIWDDGKTNIDPEKIFNRGFSHNGTGLGLPIAKELAEKQEISLSLDTTLNTSFILKFPKQLRIL